MRAHRWLVRARALAAAEDWRRLLGVARRAWSRRFNIPELSLLAAESALYLGQPTVALQWLARAAQAARPDLAMQLANLTGVALFEVGSIERAAQRFREVLEGAVHAGDRPLEARAAQNLGAVATVEGDAARALLWYRRALVAYRRADQTSGVAEVLYNLAILCRDVGDYGRAVLYAQRAARAARALRDGRLTAMVWSLAADISLRQGATRHATRLARTALRLFRRVGDHAGEAEALKLLGLSLRERGRRNSARTCLKRARKLAQSSGSGLLERELIQAARVD